MCGGVCRTVEQVSGVSCSELLHTYIVEYSSCAHDAYILYGAILSDPDLNHIFGSTDDRKSFKKNTYIFEKYLGYKNI